VTDRDDRAVVTLEDQIIQAVLTKLPDRPDVRGRVTVAVETLRLGPVGGRRLLEYLVGDEKALASGKSDGPPQRLRLIERLAPAFPDHVALARCVTCNRTGRLVRKLEGARTCNSCYAKSRRCSCIRCGNEGIIALRDGDGYMCNACYNRDTSRWEPCAGCGKTARVVQRKAPGPLCQTCADRPTYTCSRCGRPHRKAHARTSEGPICATCYHRSKLAECVTCHTVTSEVARRPDTGTWLCASCWAPAPIPCTRCGEVRVIKSSLTGNPICGACRAKSRPRRPCVECGQRRPVHSRLTHGPVCGPCYSRLRDHPGPCSTCGNGRPLIGRDGSGQPICGPCAGDPRDWMCRQCGQFGALFADQRCRLCVARERFGRCLRGPDGSLHPQLAPLVELVDVQANPRATLMWLHRSQWIAELGRLAALNGDITHTLLDEQPPSSRIVHLRAVLTYAGVIPQRQEYIESSVAWLDRFLAKQPDEIAAVLRPYATWSVLRRARHRARRRDPSRSVTKYNRKLVTLAAELMRWLATESISLINLSQADLDRWLAAGNLNRQRVRDFLRWTQAQRLTRRLEVPVGSRTQPHEFLNDDHRWQILRRCAHDSTIDVDVRVAAALVVLFGLTPTRITGLTSYDVITRSGRTSLRVGSSPLCLPASIAPLLVQLADGAARHRVPVVHDPNRVNSWLFPGAQPGRAAQPATLSSRIASTFGFKIRTARNAALCDLAQELPASVLAELLGLKIDAAIRWSVLVRTDWSAYLAARHATNHPRDPTVQPE